MDRGAWHNSFRGPVQPSKADPGPVEQSWDRDKAQTHGAESSPARAQPHSPQAKQARQSQGKQPRSESDLERWLRAQSTGQAHSDKRASKAELESLSAGSGHAYGKTGKRHIYNEAQARTESPGLRLNANPDLQSSGSDSALALPTQN